jgi:hypothetical protein
MARATTHPLSPPEIVVHAIPDDERVWVPQAPDVWFRPLMLNTLNGQWCNLLRVRRAGILGRHPHARLRAQRLLALSGARLCRQRRRLLAGRRLAVDRDRRSML